MMLPRIILPWTKTSDLSANARSHWRKRHRLTAAQKDTTAWLAKAAGWGAVVVPDGAEVHLTLTFCPPSRGGFPDDDNVIAAHKGARDALAVVLSIDDRRFRALAIPGERCKGGAVIVDARIVGGAS